MSAQWHRSSSLDFKGQSLAQRDGAEFGLGRTMFQYESAVDEPCGPGESLDEPELHLPVGMITTIAVSQDLLQQDKHEASHVKSHRNFTLRFVSRNGWPGSPGHCPGARQGFLAMGKGRDARAAQ